jgi:radical SAM protein with 4Fe4S-binding SPASM domain
MDTSIILKAISHLDDIHLHMIDITGGEPLMRKDWFEIIEYVVCNTDLALLFSTNGTLCSDADIKRISSLPGDIMVAVSLDGPTYNIHGQIRAPSTHSAWKKLFDKTVHTIKALVENGVGMCVNYVYNALNTHTVFQTYNMLREIGVPCLNIIPFYPAGAGFTRRQQLQVPFETWACFVQQLADDYIKDEPLNITVLTNFWEIFLPLVSVYGRKEAIKLTKKVAHLCSGPLDSPYRRNMASIGCNAGITHGYIDFDGTLYPCGLIPRYNQVRCGNITETDFYDIWINSPMLAQIRHQRAETIPGCTHCEYLGICGGGCRGRALTLSGDFFGPDLACPKIEVSS